MGIQPPPIPPFEDWIWFRKPIDQIPPDIRERVLRAKAARDDWNRRAERALLTSAAIIIIAEILAVIFVVAMVWGIFRAN